MESFQVFTCSFLLLLLCSCNFVSYVLIKFHMSILYINRNVITYLTYALVISVDLFVNLRVGWRVYSSFMKYTNRLLQILGSILPLFVGPFPLLLAVLIRIFFILAIFNFICIYWAIMVFRLILVFKVWFITGYFLWQQLKKFKFTWQ
jgi:hypothetical protein